MAHQDPIITLIDKLDQLNVVEELPPWPGHDLYALKDVINISPVTRRLIEEIGQLMLDELFGDTGQVLGYPLKQIRDRGYHIELLEHRDGASRKSIVIYTQRGAIEV